MAFNRIAATWGTQSPVMRGIVLMCISTIAFSIMHGLVRYVSADMHPFQVAFFRNVFGLVFLLPLIVRSNFVIFQSKKIGLHAVRGVINVIAMLMFFTALSISPLAKVTALSFTAPIFMAVLSFFILAERFRLHRWLAVVTGFVGMLIILRPGIVVIDTGALLVIGSASLWAVTMILIKILSRTESSVSIAGWMGIFLGLFSIGPALWVWQTPTLVDIGWLLLIGLFGSMAQVSLAQSLKETDPTAIMPFDFLKLIWTALIGIWFFAEVPDIFTWIGAAVIFSSGLYIAHRERRAAAAQAAVAD
ncbi:MAG: DMT family transporter [Rhizobiaceae bacterium]|nr:DMT family transporter [Hyphomicrobiales bacterium]NRB29156.1 DMT family transporter [Rhizobiaceae bacterium]